MAPAWRADCTNNDPRPPAAAGTTTTSSPRSAAWSSTATAVRPVPMRATASSASTPVGIARTAATGASACVAYPPLAWPEVGDDAGAEQARVDVLAELVDDAGDLAPGRHRQRRRRERPARLGRRRIDVSSRCTPDASTAMRTCVRAGMEVGDVLQAEDVGGAEAVVADRLHAPDGTSSSALEVKGAWHRPHRCGRRPRAGSTRYGRSMQLTETTWPEVDGRPCCASPSARASSTGRTCRWRRTRSSPRPSPAASPAAPDGRRRRPVAHRDGQRRARRRSPARCRSGPTSTAAVIVELVRSADWAAGVVLVNGHGGNRDAVDRAVTVARRRGPIRAAVVATRARRRRPRRAHRDLAAAGAAPRPRPPRPGRRRARPPRCASIGARLRAGGVRAVSPNGVLGDPAGASAAEGAALLRDPRRRPDRRGRRLARAGRGPGMTTFTLDATTRRPAGSNVVIGGSPLRLFRLTDAGVAVFDDIAAGLDVGPDPKTDRLVDRLVDAGAIHPHPATGPFTAADVTVVVPALVLGESALGRDRALLPGRRRGDRRRRRLGPAGHRRAGLARAAAADQRRAGGRPQRRPRRRRDAADRVRRHRRPARAGLARPRCSRHFADDRVGLVAPRVASAPGAGPVAAYEQGHSPLDLGPEPGRIAPGTRLSYVPAAALARAHRARCGRSTASTAACASARTSTPCGASSRPAGAVATSRRRSCCTARAGRGAASSPSGWPTGRRPRRSPSATPARSAPVRISGWSGGGVGAARRRPADPRRGPRRRHDGGARAQAPRRAGQGLAAARRPRSPVRRAPARRRRRGGRGGRLLLAGRGRLQAGPRPRRAWPPCRRC